MRISVNMGKMYDDRLVLWDVPEKPEGLPVSAEGLSIFSVAHSRFLGEGMTTTHRLLPGVGTYRSPPGD